MDGLIEVGGTATQEETVSQMIGHEGWWRMSRVCLAREVADRRADQARECWWRQKDEASLEAWKEALLDQQAAHLEYWSVTGAYMEKLGT